MRSAQGTRILTLASALLLVPALPACRGVRADAPDTLVVRRGDFHRRVLLTGELKAVKVVPLVVPRLPESNTTIRWMEADGAKVKAGDRVVELDTGNFAGTLEEKRLNESRATDEIERQEADNRRREIEKRIEVEKQKVEVKKAAIDAAVPQDSTAPREWQEAQLQLRRTETALAKAEEELDGAGKSARAELAVKRIALEKAARERATAEQAVAAMTLTAPVDGVVLAGDHPWEGRKFQEGDMIWVGWNVASLPDLSRMEVEAWLSDVDDGQVAPGMAVVCTLDSFPASTYPGEIVDVGAVAEEAARQSLRRRFRVRIALSRSDPEKMLPGMSVRVDVAARESKGVLLAPRLALDLASVPPRARLASGADKAVRLGECNAAECIVEDGLLEGEELAAQPAATSAGSGGRS